MPSTGSRRGTQAERRLSARASMTMSDRFVGSWLGSEPELQGICAGQLRETGFSASFRRAAPTC
jgi:hypothetical protein